MKELESKSRFLAVLVYQGEDHWRYEEPHFYLASHPEIAYQLAFSDGYEHEFGRNFIGVSQLDELADGIELAPRSGRGDGRDLVVAKARLHAFNEPKWKGIPCKADELQESLAEPTYLMKLDGLENVPWHTLTHAYGPAYDLPKEIRRLASSEAQHRAMALDWLTCSIYHQETLYSATEAATPFILKIIANILHPDRSQLADLLASIAESAVVAPNVIREAWEWREHNLPKILGIKASEEAAKEIAVYEGVRLCLIEHLELIEQLATDVDSGVAGYAQAIARHLSGTRAR